MAHCIGLRKTSAANFGSSLQATERQIKLTGDSSKVLMLAAQMAPPAEGDPQRDQLREIVARIDAITA